MVGLERWKQEEDEKRIFDMQVNEEALRQNLLNLYESSYSTLISAGVQRDLLDKSFQDWSDAQGTRSTSLHANEESIDSAFIKKQLL